MVSPAISRDTVAEFRTSSVRGSVGTGTMPIVSTVLYDEERCHLAEADVFQISTQFLAANAGLVGSQPVTWNAKIGTPRGSFRYRQYPCG